MKKNATRLFATILLVVVLAIPVIAIQTDSLGSADTGSETTTMTSGLDLQTDQETPTKSEEVVLKWIVSKETLEGTEMKSEDWDCVPSTPVIVGDYAYVRIHGYLYKLSMETGESVASVTSKAGNFMYGHTVDYADYNGGIILDGLCGIAYDLNLKQLYTFDATYSKMTYYDGYIYGMGTSLVKYSAVDEDTNSMSEVKSSVSGWNCTIGASLYPIFIGDYGYTIDNGLTSFKLSDGSLVDNYSISGNFNSELTYYENHIYATTYTGGIFSTTDIPGTVVSVPVDIATGQLDSENTKILQLTDSKNNSSLLICNGWGYVNCQDYFRVIDISTMEVVAQIGGTYAARGNMAMSTGYITDDADGYKVYLYVIPYQDTGTISVYSDSIINGEHVLERTELTNMGLKQYNTETVCFGNNGELVWHNDAKCLYCYAKTNQWDGAEVGDVNADGELDLKDAVLISQYIVGNVSFSNAQVILADYNNDGAVTLKDAVLIAKRESSAYSVTINISPSDATDSVLTIYSDEGLSNQINYKLYSSGTYYYTISSEWYETYNGSFTVDDEDIIVDVSLTQKSSDSFYTITDDGDITAYSGPGGDVVIPDTINGISPLKLSAYAFSNHNTIASVTLCDSISTLEDKAFNGCKLLETINIGNGVSSMTSGAIVNCILLKAVNAGADNSSYMSVSGVLYSKSTMSMLILPANVTDITIPSGVTITNSMFYRHSSLTNVVIESGVIFTGNDAFSGCSALKTVTLSQGLTSIGRSAFKDCTSLESITIPGSIKNLPDGLFVNCTSLKYAIIMEGVETITSPSYMFYNTTNLSYVSLPNTLTSVDGALIYNAPALESIVIPNGLTSISNVFVYNCPNLKSMSFGSSITTVNLGSAFSGLETVYLGASVSSVTISAPNLKNVYIDSKNTHLKMIDDTLYSYDMKTLYSHLAGSTIESVTIPDSVETISASAFNGSTYLKSVILGSGVASISDKAFSGCTNLQSIIITDSVTTCGNSVFKGCTSLTSATIGDGLTSIPSNTFQGCTGLKSITIPNKITSIGNYSFYQCTSLESVIIGNGVTSIGTSAFQGCTGLTSLTIGNGVQTINKNSFNGCSVLSSVDIPDSVTSIGDTAFQNCDALKSVSIGSGLTTLGKNVFAGCPIESMTVDSNNTAFVLENGAFSDIAKTKIIYFVSGITGSYTVPSTVVEIAEYAFYKCSLTSLTISDNVTTLGGYSIGGTDLESLYIGNGIKTIGETVLAGCTGLKSVTIGSSVVTINEKAFVNCPIETMSVSDNSKVFVFEDHALMDRAKTKIIYFAGGITGSYTVPSTVTEILTYAFYNCSLTSLTISDNVTTLGQYSIGGDNLETVNIGSGITEIGRSVFEGCKGLKSIVIGDEVTTVGYKSFKDCTALTSVTMGKKVTTIDQYAFYGCTSLNSIAIGNIVNVIGNYAFCNCTALTSVTIPDNVTRINSSAFMNDSSLVAVYFEGTIPSIANNAFNGVSENIVYYSHGDNSKYGVTNGSFYYVSLYVGESNLVKEVIVVDGQSLDLTLYTSTYLNLSGVTITSWNTMFDGTGTSYAASICVAGADISLYAQTVSKGV